MTNFKSKLAITTTVASALALAGCGQRNDWDDGVTQRADRDTAVCTDKRTGQRVADSNCERRSGGGGGSSAFLWYFLGRNAAVPYYGDRVGGGSYARSPGASYFRAPASTSMSRSTAISRGGFGSSARSSSFSVGG